MSTALEPQQLQASLRKLIVLSQAMLALDPDQYHPMKARLDAREAIIQTLPSQLTMAEKNSVLPLLVELKALDDHLKTRLIQARNAYCKTLRQIHFTQEVLTTYQVTARR